MRLPTWLIHKPGYDKGHDSRKLAQVCSGLGQVVWLFSPGVLSFKFCYQAINKVIASEISRFLKLAFKFHFQ